MDLPVVGTEMEAQEAVVNESTPWFDVVLTDDQKNKIISEFDRSNGQMSGFRDKCKKLYEAYAPTSRELKKKTQVDVPSLKGLVGVSQKAGRMAAEFLAFDDIMGVAPYYIQDVNTEDYYTLEDRAEKGQQTANYLLHLGNFKSETLLKSIWDSTIYPMAFAESTWTTDFRTINGKDVPISQYPSCNQISPFRAVPDMSALAVQKGRFFYQILYNSDIEIKRKAASGYYDPEAVSKLRYNSQYDINGYLDQFKDKAKEYNNASYDTGYCTLISGYVYLDPEGNGPSLYHVVYDHESKQFLRVKARIHNHNMIPVVGGSMLLRPDTLTGISPLETIYYQLQEYNYFRNLGATNVTLAAALTLLVQESSGINLDNIKKRLLGNVLKGTNISPAAIRQLEMRSFLPDIQNFLQMIDWDMSAAIGYNDLTLALKAPDTAKGAQIMQAQAQMNQEISTIIFSQTFLQPLFEMFWSDIQQFFDMSVWVKLKDGKPVRVTRDDLQGEFIVTVGDLISQAKAKIIGQGLMQSMAMIGQTGLRADYGKMVSYIWKGMGVPTHIANDVMPQGMQTPANSLKAQGVMGMNDLPVGDSRNVEESPSSPQDASAPVPPGPVGPPPAGPTQLSQDQQIPPEVLEQLLRKSGGGYLG